MPQAKEQRYTFKASNLEASKMNIKYPDWIPSDLKCEIKSNAILLNDNYSQTQKKLYKRLVEDPRMKEVYTTLYNVKNDHNMLAKRYFGEGKTPLGMLPATCIEILNEQKNITPLTAKRYKGAIRSALKHTQQLLQDINKLEAAGIIEPKWLTCIAPLIISSMKDQPHSEYLLEHFIATPNEAYSDLEAMLDRDERWEPTLESHFPSMRKVLSELLAQLKLAENTTPKYARGNTFITRKKNHYAEQYFIGRLSVFLNAFFLQPHDQINATITNTIFLLDEKYTANRVLRIRSADSGLK